MADYLVDVLDIFNEIIARFGTGLAALHENIQKTLLRLLGHARPLIRKKASSALGVLAYSLSDNLFAELMNFLRSAMADKKPRPDQLRSLVQTVGFIWYWPHLNFVTDRKTNPQ